MFGSRANVSLLTKQTPKSLVYKGSFLQTEVKPEVTSDVCIFRNFVTKDFCEKFVEFFKDSTDWKKSITYGEGDGLVTPEKSPRQSSQIRLLDFRCADGYVFSIFAAALAKFREDNTYLDVGTDEGYSLLRYGVGGEYQPHVDYGKSNSRILSGLLYLNDDFEGGELSFPRQNLIVRPEPGMVVFFPSNYTHVHASLPIRSGTKYAVVTWFK